MQQTISRTKDDPLTPLCFTRSHWVALLRSYLRFQARDDAIKWKHFPRYGPFVRGIHRSPVNSPHEGQWRGASIFSFHTVSNELNFILYADDTTLTSPLCSFTHGAQNDVSHVSSQINSELLKISDWLKVNKLSLNVDKTKYMIFHNYQRVIANEDIPDLQINDKMIERVSCFNFLGLTIHEFMKWSSHSAKIANRISRTLGIMNRLKRYLPFSAMKLMYESLILSHLQFGITCWGFEWNRMFKLQKRALRIMTNSKYNAHTEPLFKELELLKVKNIFDL